MRLSIIRASPHPKRVAVPPQYLQYQRFLGLAYGSFSYTNANFRVVMEPLVVVDDTDSSDQFSGVVRRELKARNMMPSCTRDMPTRKHRQPSEKMPRESVSRWF